MCPACWATAIAACAGLSAISILAIALKDCWTLSFAIALSILLSFERLSYFALPNWIAYLIVALLLVRISFLVSKSVRGEGTCNVWAQARGLAAKTCRTRAGVDPESPDRNQQ